MGLFKEFISEELAYALGWTVIHSLWQALLVVLILMGLNTIIRKYSATVRYQFQFAGLLAVAVLSAGTFWSLYASEKADITDPVLVIEFGEQGLILIKDVADQALTSSFFDWLDRYLPLIVILWLTGVFFFFVRLLGSFIWIQHLRYNQNHLVSRYWQDKLRVLSHRIGLHKRVELVESHLIRMPMMLGYLKPVILLPIGVINGLEEEQVEAILAHELAHIYRHDYLLNIIQSIIEVLFYFNPAVWWISSNIRVERENCCDDMAIALCGNSVSYVKALVRIQESNTMGVQLAMQLSTKKNQLLKRVKRILKQPQDKSTIMEKFIATTFLSMALLLFSVSSPAEEVTPPTIVDLAPLQNMVAERESSGLIALDTLPKGKIKIEVDRDGERVETTLEDGAIKSLSINGKEVPKSEFPDYEEYIEDLLDTDDEEIEEERSYLNIRERILDGDVRQEGDIIIIGRDNMGRLDTMDLDIDMGDGDIRIFLNENFEPGSQFEILGEELDRLDGKGNFRVYRFDGDEENRFEWKVEPDSLKSLYRFEKFENFFPKDSANSLKGFGNINFDFDWMGTDSLLRTLEDIKAFGAVIPEGFMYKNGELRGFAPRELYFLQDSLLRKERIELRELQGRIREQARDYSRLQREEMIELQERVREQARDYSQMQMEELKEQQEKIQKHYQKIQKVMQEKLEKEQELIRKQMEVLKEQGEAIKRFKREEDAFTKIIKAELSKDGFTSNGNFSFFLNGKGTLKINGEKQPTAVYEKYKALYEKHTGKTLHSKSRISIEHQEDDTK